MRLEEFTSKLQSLIKNDIDTKAMPRVSETYRKRLEMDLNRIAQARIIERSLNENLTFIVIQDGPRSLSIIPSNPVLFKKLEFGEFNPDGSLRTPPHSVMEQIKVFIR